MTTAGKRSRRIEFQRQGSPTDDGYTTQPGEFAYFTEAFAEVLFGTGQERREAAQEAGSQAATFIVPSTPKIALVGVSDRISGIGAVWDITSIAPVGLNREIHFTATRSV